VWFALEEKGIPFETEFIDLSNKPQWYLDLVPTALVPAAKIDGKLIYESKDILLALEERFPEAPLLPQNPLENAIARQWVEEAETNGFKDAAYNFLRHPTTDAHELADLQATFEAKLDLLEQLLENYPGPFFVSSFSLVDLMYSPHLDRLAANLPVYRNYTIKGNPRFPRINAWFDALKHHPAYHRVRSDSTTNHLLLRRRWGVEPIGNPVPLDDEIAQTSHHRAETAERLSDNHDVAIGDILKNSGAQVLAINGDDTPIRDAIDWHLRLLADYLLHGNSTPLPWGRIGGKDNSDPLVAAVGAITLAYVRNRICAPRDMSAGAATAFRHAADTVLSALY
jgi:glutathione S-transferase